MPAWLFKWQTLLGTALLIAVLSFGIGWTVCSWSRDSDQLSDLRDSVEDQAALGKRLNTVSADLQSALTKLKKANYANKKEADDDIAANPDYANCFISDRMQQLINRATSVD